MPLYLVELPKFLKRRLELTGCQPAPRCRQGKTHSQLHNLVVYRLLLGHLPPYVLTLPEPCDPGTYLIDEDRLPELLNKPNDRLRVSRLVENPCHLPFLQQCLRPLPNVVEGPADDQFRGKIAEYTVQTFPTAHASPLLLDYHRCWCS
jgi:hypothetical protein